MLSAAPKDPSTLHLAIALGMRLAEPGGPAAAQPTLDRAVDFAKGALPAGDPMLVAGRLALERRISGWKRVRESATAFKKEGLGGAIPDHYLSWSAFAEGESKPPFPYGDPLQDRGILNVTQRD